MSIIITGVGSYIPKNRIKNSGFWDHQFVNKDGSKIETPTKEITEKFKAITGIEERRYGDDDQTTSKIATLAAEKAIADSGVDPETLDYIIIGQNFGDVSFGSHQTDQCPNLAARVKYNLRIKNPKCVAYDVIFGCPGWLEGVIQAQAFMRAGMAKKCMVIGAEMLSRVVDPYDRDSMIFADGAGAVILEEKDREGGILAHSTASYTYSETPYLTYNCSYNIEEAKNNIRYIKMSGRKIYNFALKKVPAAMKACLEQSGKSIHDLKKIFIHQANEKMDEAMVQRFFKLYDLPLPEGVMPMNIYKLGNSSVATLPTLLDMVRRGEIEGQELHEGDVIIFASVGAGMNINAIVYQY